MNFKSLIFYGFLISTGLLNAQTDFRPGYIINTSGDTIYGEIDYRGDLLMNSICNFKDANEKITEYFPSDLIAYRFIDSKYYTSREVNHKTVFLEYLIKGKVNIYFLRDDKGDHFYLDKEDVQLIEIPYEEGIRYVGRKQVFYESNRHKGLLIYYLQDAPELQSRIKSLDKPDHQNLTKLAEEYHNAVCDDEICIIYEKRLPFIKILPEIVGGVAKYSNTKVLNDKFFSQVGIIGHIWMPRKNEKMYFRSGLLFTHFELDGEKGYFYKIPLQFEYIYPKGIIRPRIAYGLNFYFPPHFNSVSFNPGGNIKITETLYLSATSEIEFYPKMFILPKELVSYSVLLGILMKF